MSKLKEVTKKDVAHAALIAQLIAGAYLADAYLCCIEIPPRKLHDCPECKHVEHGEYCDHYEDWDCVASAIGATINAVHLWLSFSNAISTTTEDRDGELRKEGTKRELLEHARLYAWVDSIREGGIHHDEWHLNNLEVAALLREGHLPPGWRLVARRRKLAKAPSLTPNRHEDVRVGNGKLPMVQVRMTASGPVAEAGTTARMTLP